jgi:DNA-binding NtrC family response regulator
VAERVLLVEDREHLRAMLGRALSREFVVDEADSAEAARVVLASARYAVVVTDVRLPGASGVELLKEIRTLLDAPEVVLMTAYAAVPAAVEAVRAGAYDYLEKPFEPDRLVEVVRRAADRHALVQRTQRLEALLADRETAWVGSSAASARIRDRVHRLSPSPHPILIYGETGVGKRHFAREVARRWGGGLLELSPKDASFDALWDRWWSARSETAYLPDIESLTAEQRTALDGVVGETGAPLIVSTRLPPDALRQTMAPSVYFSLQAMAVHLPPLRERPEDVFALAASFLHKASAHANLRARSLSPEALGVLQTYAWPGNVRELAAAIEHAMLVGAGPVVEWHDLPEWCRGGATRGASGTWRDAMERAQDEAGRAYLIEALARHAGNVTRTAAEAGIERESLHRLLRRYDIDPQTFRMRRE